MKARLSTVRISPRKMGLLVDEIRGKDINKAMTYLRMSPRKKAADSIYGLLKSAVANAESKGTVDIDQLFVKSIMVGQGPTYKRFRPRAKGSASGILKRTSHVTVELGER